jgi:riboflavin kinase/FMN adenylyltransferase
MRQLPEAIPVAGIVQHGDERGRTLGFPTANLHDVDHVPLDGVYAGIFTIDPEEEASASYVTVVSLGHRPTYYGKDGLRLLEAHVLGFEGDLYGASVRVDLHLRLRPQRRFANTAALVHQLRLDLEETQLWAIATDRARMIVDDPERMWSRGRWGQRQRRTSGDKTRPTMRRLHHTELIARAVLEAPSDQVTHEWVAEHTGLSVAYISRQFPTLEGLRAW